MIYGLIFSLILGSLTALIAVLWAKFVGAGLAQSPEIERLDRLTDLKTW